MACANKFVKKCSTLYTVCRGEGNRTSRELSYHGMKSARSNQAKLHKSNTGYRECTTEQAYRNLETDNHGPLVRKELRSQDPKSKSPARPWFFAGSAKRFQGFTQGTMFLLSTSGPQGKPWIGLAPNRSVSIN